jgi:hypothetical protein
MQCITEPVSENPLIIGHTHLAIPCVGLSPLPKPTFRCLGNLGPKTLFGWFQSQRGRCAAMKTAILSATMSDDTRLDVKGLAASEAGSVILGLHSDLLCRCATPQGVSAPLRPLLAWIIAQWRRLWE